MLRKETSLGLNEKERLDLRVEEKDDVTFAIKQVVITQKFLKVEERNHRGNYITTLESGI